MRRWIEVWGALVGLKFRRHRVLSRRPKLNTKWHIMDFDEDIGDVFTSRDLWKPSVFYDEGSNAGPSLFPPIALDGESFYQRASCDV